MELLGDVAKKRGKTVVIVSPDQRIKDIAVRTLVSLVFTNMWNLDGGMVE